MTADEAFSSPREETVLWGSLRVPPRLPAALSGLHFQISPSAFFQTDTAQAELLHESIARLAGACCVPAQMVLGLGCCGM